MTAADLPAVFGIERAAYEFPWPEGVFRDCLRAGHACRVAEAGRRIRGYGILSLAAGEAHLLNLCVDPFEQGRGWGRWLLRHLFGLARGRNAQRMLLEVRPSNRTAVQLYEAHGFVHAGTRRGYYPGAAGKREDARVYVLPLRLENSGRTIHEPRP